ncbi:MAG TPA: TIGR03557 family F420-dependent LLM class oxidoreductase [Polyangiaceae bacterium]|nr:TIGR03557 family F420-dependent LLM class oxidoreductase [Polyangiaceae bacterium]
MDRRTWLASAGALIGVAGCQTKGRGEKVVAESRNVAGANRPIQQRSVGFQLAQEQFTMPELVELGVLAEQAGFDVVTASDHLQPWQANQGHSGFAWLTLCALGQRTKRVWLGTTVTCPTFRYHPAVVAQGFASLSALYPGRIFLGVGSGEALNEQAATGEWPNWNERSERLIEATDIIRRLWSGAKTERQGRYYNVNARLYDPPSQPIPLLMAANGPKAMRRAGQHADGLVTDSKTWKQHKGEFERGWNEAGKTHAAKSVFIEHYAVVGNEEDARAAAELWRFGPKAWKPYVNIPDPARIEELSKSEIPLEEVYKDWVVSTDPNVHAKAILDLFESGATEVNIHSGQADQRRVIAFYGDEVLPRLARGSGRRDTRLP